MTSGAEGRIVTLAEYDTDSTRGGKEAGGMTRKYFSEHTVCSRPMERTARAPALSAVTGACGICSTPPAMGRGRFLFEKRGKRD